MAPLLDCKTTAMRGPRGGPSPCVWSMLLVGLCVATACERTPETMAECSALSQPVDREECYLSIAQGLTRNPPALEAALADVPADNSRDLLRLRLAVQDPVRLGFLCRGVEGEDAQKRCHNIVHRPHLQKPPPGAR